MTIKLYIDPDAIAVLTSGGNAAAYGEPIGTAKLEVLFDTKEYHVKSMVQPEAGFPPVLFSVTHR